VIERPVVYILHGDDEYAIAGYLVEMEAKIGDPSAAEMNTARIDGGTFSLEALTTVTRSLPFLAERRLVILTNPLDRMKSPTNRERFISVLEQVPSTTALVLVIHRPLVSPNDKRKGIKHWLQKWAIKQDGRVYEREFLLPRSQMAHWIQAKASEQGGIFTERAAVILAEYVQEDPRTAAQEIEKLLTYVNYQRPIDHDDVLLLTPFTGEGDVFKMVDAIGIGNGPLALRMYHQLLEVDDPLRLFGMIVRQFRLLLLTRELLDTGNREGEIASQLKIQLFLVRKLIGQVSNFSMESLEDIYRRLLEVDVEIKTGQIPGEIALDILITSLTH